MAIEDYKNLLNKFKEYVALHNLIMTKAGFIRWIKSNHYERKFNLYRAEEVYFGDLEDSFGL